MLAVRTLVTVFLSAAATLGLAVGISPRVRETVKATIHDAARAGAEIGAQLEQSIEAATSVEFGAEAQAGGEASVGGTTEVGGSLEVGGESTGEVDLDLGDRIEAMLNVWSQQSADADVSAQADGQFGGEAGAGSNFWTSLKALFGG